MVSGYENKDEDGESEKLKNGGREWEEECRCFCCDFFFKKKKKTKLTGSIGFLVEPRALIGSFIFSFLSQTGPS